MRKLTFVTLAASTLLAAACASMMEDKSTSFFVPSVNPGNGGALGGLAGAAADCNTLASAAGAGSKTWHAYLSTASANARDRIGKGPWYNSKGVMVAANLDELHGTNKIDKTTGLDEKGHPIKVRGDTPNQHDMLTGSTPDGRVVAGATCNDWTASSGSSAMVGHLDRTGTNPAPVAHASWTSSHKTPGCSMPNLARMGG